MNREFGMTTDVTCLNTLYIFALGGIYPIIRCLDAKLSFSKLSAYAGKKYWSHHMENFTLTFIKIMNFTGPLLFISSICQFSKVQAKM